MVPTSYDGLDDDDKVKMVSESNQNNNNNYNEVSDFKSDDKAKENIFGEDANDEVKATPKTMVHAKAVQAMRKFEVLYNNDANKIAKEAA